MLRRVLGRLTRKMGLRRDRPAPAAPTVPAIPAERKLTKLERIRSILRDDMPFRHTQSHFDFLTPELRTQCGICETDNVSAHVYDVFAEGIVERNRNGLVLDCGAGLRPVYYDNVVNFEIVPYPTTDVLGVGERLPFKDSVFDAVFSLAVLEHVRDPFACAKEIARVMKPGGELYCVVPFQAVLHGYPHHYYNMSHQGLRNLFEPYLVVERQEMLASGLPIWNLTDILRRWASGLSKRTRRKFLRMRVGDLIGDAVGYLSSPVVRELPQEINFELASTTALFARKAA